MKALALLPLLVVSSVCWTDADAVYKLQNDSKPLSYMLHLEPNIPEDYFNAIVIIDFTMMVKSSVLMIHQKNLVIHALMIEGIPIRKWDADNVKEALIIYCKSDLIEDRVYQIKIKYSGLLNKYASGFYKSSYHDGTKTKWIAMTHFEPTYARLAFPCWDEPAYKAIFDISIRHLSNYTTVISNMPIERKDFHFDDTITTYFNRSIPMSTYLVAFIVSDYSFIRYDDHRFKIFTTQQSVYKTELAYSFSVEAMKAMDEYTEIPYFEINPKIDQVSTTHSLSDAMHNWGIITYRENYLLYEEGVSTTMDKGNIITTISHVFANQWFGNLVSPKRWEFVWLNKGFATYFQFLIAHKVKPTWRFMDMFPVKTMQWGAFRFENWNNIHLLNQYENHPEEIRRLFNQIADEKAACIIRMLSHILTETVFHTALKNYLRNNSYSVSDYNDLIKHLQNAAGHNKTWDGVYLADIVRTWVTQPEYPMVTVRKMSPGRYTLSQRQYLFYVPVDYQVIQYSELKTWWIPITYATNRNLNFTDTSVTHWMKRKVRDITIVEPGTDWIILNKQQTGFYRVNYDDEIWYKLTEYLKSSNMHHIHPVNRAQLLDDALAMARSNLLKYETALSLTLYLNREIDYIPWMSAFSNIAILIPDVLPCRHFDIFKQYIKYILHSLMKNVTYAASPNDDYPMKVIRAEAIQLACLVGDKECVDEANKDFNAWLKDPTHRFDPDLKATILCTGLRTASEAVWKKVLKKLTQESIDGDGAIFNEFSVLGCSTNETILQKFLIYAIKTNWNIRLETAVRAVLANIYVKGMEIVQHILDNEFEMIKNMYNFNFEINAVAESISTYVKTNEDFLWLSTFVESIGSSDKVVQRIMTRSMRNINRIATLETTFDDWLIKNQELFKSRGTKMTSMSLLLVYSLFNTMLCKMFL